MANEVKKESKKLSLDEFKVDKKKVSQADIDAALELLAKKRYTSARIKAGEIKGGSAKPYSELSADEKKKRQLYSKRLSAKKTLIALKAKAAGITVSEKEVDEYIAKH